MKWKLVLRILGIVFLLAQFFRPARTNPPVTESATLEAQVSVPDEVHTLMRNACYDCHSNLTEWPWYASVAPASWLVVHDVDEGRRHLNFSAWGDYPPSRAAHKLEEIVELVGEGEMPLRFYAPLHPEARLSEADRQTIVSWARSLRADMELTEEEEHADHDHDH